MEGLSRVSVSKMQFVNAAVTIASEQEASFLGMGPSERIGADFSVQMFFSFLFNLREEQLQYPDVPLPSNYSHCASVLQLIDNKDGSGDRGVLSMSAVGTFESRIVYTRQHLAGQSSVSSYGPILQLIQPAYAGEEMEEEQNE
ncbi:Serine/Threonine-Protein Kinase/Endoribonuclease Ire2 [Manis pentadactyla]|nr:Serine/Threonine-Protein Kinase/Endoribonuclease Ire2 [Manis pentadactyla]